MIDTVSVFTMPRIATSTAMAICAYARPSHCSVRRRDPRPHFPVRQHEQPLRAGEPLDDPLPHVHRRHALLHVDAEDVDRVVAPPPDVAGAVHQDGALTDRTSPRRGRRSARCCTPVGVASSIVSPSCRPCSAREVVGQDDALALRRPARTSRAGLPPAAAWRGRPSTSPRRRRSSPARPCRSMRWLRTRWTSSTPSISCQFVAKRRREPEVPLRQALRRRDEQVRVQRRRRPVHDRVVAGPRDAAQRDDERERQHQRRHGGRRAARRLDQAVGGERALDRPEPAAAPAAAPASARARPSGSAAAAPARPSRSPA